MRSTLLFAAVLFTGPLPAASELVLTTDGRSIELNDDGTYEVLDTVQFKDTDYVSHGDHYFFLHRGEYNTNRIRFMPIFTNLTDKRIVGTKFNAEFQNAFGDTIFEFSGETDESIRPGQQSSYDLFYYFEDNQFMAGQPYDKLLPMVTNDSGKILVTLQMIAFEGGEIVKISE